MYSTGTVTATANSTKLVGTGTKWLNNINRVSAEQAIQVQIGTTVHNNSIQSIQSDTELTLNFPLPTAATGAKYVILTTMVHSVSDAMNKIVSMNGANVQFSDILTRWMTEQGIITVTLPDQTIQQLRTTKEMDKQLDGKLNSSGNINLNKGVLTIFNPLSSLLRLVVDEDNSNYISFFKNGKTDSANRTAVIGYGDKDLEEFQITNSKVNRTIVIHRDGVRISGKGDVLTIGDFGVGSIDGVGIPNKDYNNIQKSGFYAGPGGAADVLNLPPKSSLGDPRFGGAIMVSRSAQEGFLIAAHNNEIVYRPRVSSVWRDYQRFYTTANTTKDAQGNLRAASPIIKVFADHIDPNEEAEGVVLEKLGVGRYKLKGVLGMNSDASWGGFNGGIVIPKGINGLELVWADYKVLADGDIILETHYRKHSDLPPPVVLNRLIAYPEFMDENGNELESYTPCDIPNGHWIDIRVQMPSDSIYNQKQAEAQRLAKIEAERLAEMDIDV
ncbi:hypothetical protein [Providencia rettgeri]|uniref:phage tail fiber protein n=1 Tax=Providencia rettgeri TaxID=587 RepID=UPI002361F5D4|nr:hypothetical protein [Providencia rettgeri]